MSNLRRMRSSMRAWIVAVLGVAGVLVVRGAAREEGALGRDACRAGCGRGWRRRRRPDSGPNRLPLTSLNFSSCSASSTLPRSCTCASSQANASVTQSFMPMSRSDMTITGVCSRSARSKACAPIEKHSVGIGREQQHVLGVAVRGIGAGDDVGLLRARRHAGRRAAALDVEQHHRHLGEVGKPQELAHQRDAGPGRGRKRARAVPAAADGNADGRQLVLGLHDAVKPPAVLGDAQAPGVASRRPRPAMSRA